MTFETKNRAAILAARAKDIVLDEARWPDTWSDRNPTADTELAVAVAEARKKYAADILSIQRSELNRAQNVVDMWSHNGWGTAPAWARSTVERLKHLEETGADGVDEAITALQRAVA